MARQAFTILAINPGSTSTKFAVFKNDEELFSQSLRHSETALSPFSDKPILDQVDFRYNCIAGALNQKKLELKHHFKIK